MLNAVKYKDEILDKYKEYSGDVYSMFKAIDDIAKVSMSFNDAIKWLLSEYEPPLLENGDGLEQGQVIEVSEDGEKWIERKFLTYYKGLFWCYGGVFSVQLKGGILQEKRQDVNVRDYKEKMSNV